MLAPHLQITHGGGNATMPQQGLDGAQIDTRLQQMSGKAVTQSMNAPAPVNAGFLLRADAKTILQIG